MDAPECLCILTQSSRIASSREMMVLLGFSVLRHDPFTLKCLHSTWHRLSAMPLCGCSRDWVGVNCNVQASRLGVVPGVVALFVRSLHSMRIISGMPQVDDKIKWKVCYVRPQAPYTRGYAS